MSKSSTFMIVINTNKQINKIEKEKVENLVKLTKYLVNNLNNKTNNYYVDKSLEPLTKTEFNKIEKVQSDYNVEIGEKFGRFHFNIYVDIKHNTYLRMNTKAISNLYEKVLGDKCNVKVKATGNNILKLKEYALKNKTSVKQLFNEQIKLKDIID